MNKIYDIFINTITVLKKPFLNTGHSHCDISLKYSTFLYSVRLSGRGTKGYQQIYVAWKQ